MTAQGNYTGEKMTRREIREAIFKLIFLSGFNSEEEMKEQLEVYFKGAGSDIRDDQEEDFPDDEDAAVVNDKYQGVVLRLDDIDGLLNEISRGWKTSRMGRVDLAILRLAVYEMRYDDAVPVSVAINEAVEMAKKYGGNDSASFINGILGKIAKENKE